MTQLTASKLSARQFRENKERDQADWYGRIARKALEMWEESLRDYAYLLYGCILMTFSSTYHATGDPDAGKSVYEGRYEKPGVLERFAQDLEWSKLATEREKAFVAMAYSEYSLGHLANNKDEEARKLARWGRKILLGSDESAHTSDGTDLA